MLQKEACLAFSTHALQYCIKREISGFQTNSYPVLAEVSVDGLVVRLKC